LGFHHTVYLHSNGQEQHHSTALFYVAKATSNKSDKSTHLLVL